MGKNEYINLINDNASYIKSNFGVESLLIFGSVARNQATKDSDVDVCVSMEADMFKRYQLKEFLQMILQKPVDVIRYRNGMNKVLQSEIDRDGIRVF